MFLTNPTVDELQKLDLPVLFDMLAYQTGLHFKQLKVEGISSSTDATKELILNLQAAIEIKKNLEKNQGDNNGTNTSSQDAVSVSPLIN